LREASFDFDFGGLQDPETESITENRHSERLRLFVRNARSFPKTAAEIKAFSLARLLSEYNDDAIIIVSLRALARRQAPLSNLHHSSPFRVEPIRPTLLTQALSHYVDLSKVDYLREDFRREYGLLGTSVVPEPQTLEPQTLETIDNHDPYGNCEVTVTAGVALLLTDSWHCIRDYTISWMMVWGGLVQLVAYLLGGLDLQLKAVTALVLIFLASKALLSLRSGEFGQAFWRVLHFPLWMTLIAVASLGDTLHAETLVSLRGVAMFFVTTWTLGGSTNAILLLLGIERANQFRKDVKRAFRRLFEDEDEE
jgi:hypothetical protein